MGCQLPNQYSTLELTETNSTRTTYGGSEKYSKLEQDPRLLELFAGYSFSKEYNEDRGHLNSLTDVRGIKRINQTSPGTCYSCKSAKNPTLWTELGMRAYDKTLFSVLGRQINEPIGCANCHEANTMRVEITSQNHGFEVVAESLPADVAITHRSLFDNCVEGLALKSKPVFSVQYHPEASPGPQDSHYLFHRFVENMAKKK